MKSAKLFLFGFLIVLLGCQKDADTTRQDGPRDSRLKIKNQVIPLTPGFGLKTEPAEPIGFEFTLIAEVDAPVVDGQTVQATHVEIIQDWAFVSYNMRGSQQLGAIDIIDITNPAYPQIVKTILFDDKDVNTVGWLNGHIVIAGQDVEGAYYGFYSLDDETLEINRLQSYSAMSMVIENNDVYVVSGDTGGLTIIDASGNEEFLPYTDARSVAVNDNVFVLTSEYIDIVNGDQIPIDPNHIQYASKAELSLSNEYLFAALNRGGVHIYDLDDLSLFQVIDRPFTPEGMDEENYVTNGVSYNEPLLFVANGAAGILVSGKSDLFKSDHEFLTYGYFDFNGPLSSNFVVSEGDYVFVASGLGGLKILTIQEISYTDDCIWREETGYGGSVSGSGAWWYYLENTGETKHPIYAGQQLIDGAYIEINPINGSDKVEMVIELGPKLRLQETTQPVKIQGYNYGELPSSRPPSGLFTTYRGDQLIIELPNYPYYVVHLDVEVCYEP